MCDVDWCEKPPETSGLCLMHYTRRRRPQPGFHWAERYPKDDGPRLCVYPGCRRKHDSRGYCSIHYARLRLHGDPSIFTHRFIKDADERFWAYVTPTGFCWEWGGFVNPQGYGKVYPGTGSGEQLAHRAAYAKLIAPVPGDMTLDHLCRNKRCVNPDHLEIVSGPENGRRNRVTRACCAKGHDLSLYGAVWGGALCCKLCERNRKRRRASE